MRKRPEIPEDVFFDTTPVRNEPEAEPDLSESAPDPEDNEQNDCPPEDILRKSMANSEERTRVKLSEVRVAREQRDGGEVTSQPRIGRPPAQEGPKVAVTLYLTEPVAHLLEEVKFRLLTEYDLRTSKSAIADFALRNGLRNLQAAADDLRRD